MAHIEVSMTETEQFQRLVQFMFEVEEHADIIEDADLTELVENCRTDLLQRFS